MTRRAAPQEAKFEVRIVFVANEFTTKAEIRQHIVDAVRNWGGQYPPDDDFFPTNIKAVRVRIC